MAILTTTVTDRRPVAVTVQLDGEIDLSGAEQLDRAVQDVTRLGAAPVVVVDLAGTTFMDSTGIQFLARLAKLAEAQGSSFYIIGARPSVRRLIELTEFADTLLTFEARQPHLV